MVVLVLFSVLPELAKKFYEAWGEGDVSSHLGGSLRLPEHPKGRMLRELMKRHASVEIDDLHVCTHASKVVVELCCAGDKESKLMHSLTFTDDGLVSAFVPYCLQPELLSTDLQPVRSSSPC